MKLDPKDLKALCAAIIGATPGRVASYAQDVGVVEEYIAEINRREAEANKAQQRSGGISDCQVCHPLDEFVAYPPSALVDALRERDAARAQVKMLREAIEKLCTKARNPFLHIEDIELITEAALAATKESKCAAQVQT